MKRQTFNSESEVDNFIAVITRSAEATKARLAELQAEQGLKFLWKLKFEKAGCDPLDSKRELNLIEQLNQTFTYLATARGVKILLQLHPELAPFTVNLGTAGGRDIESNKGGGVAAEVFASVSPKNNQKLKKDLEKLSACNAKYRYVFFMSPDYPKGRHEKLETVSGVEVWSVGDTL